MSPADYLLKDYELKVRYLTDHFSRMWTRFNFFLTINSALFVASINLNKDNHHNIWLLAVLGFAFSLVWNQFGATDNYLADSYRKQVALAHYLLQEALRNENFLLPATDEHELKTFSYAGNIQDEIYNVSKKCIEKLEQGFWQRRWKHASVTELAIIFSILFALAWLLRFLAWLLNCYT
jgi:hypothetical protein